MRTRTTKFVCDHCFGEEATENDTQYNTETLPDDWASVLLDDSVYAESKSTVDLCGGCYVAIIAIRKMGKEMVETWFNERDRSKTTT